MQGSLGVSRAIGDKHLGRRDTLPFLIFTMVVLLGQDTLHKASAKRLDDNNAQATSQVTAVPCVDRCDKPHAKRTHRQTSNEIQKNSRPDISVIDTDVTQESTGPQCTDHDPQAVPSYRYNTYYAKTIVPDAPSTDSTSTSSTLQDIKHTMPTTTTKTGEDISTLPMEIQLRQTHKDITNIPNTKKSAKRELYKEIKGNEDKASSKKPRHERLITDVCSYLL
ncbi:hypothetical protein Tco_1427594 [Tanacetum coccineum]